MPESTKFKLTLPNGAVIELEGDREYVTSAMSQVERLAALATSVPINLSRPKSDVPGTSAPPLPATPSGDDSQISALTSAEVSQDELRGFLDKRGLKKSPQQLVAAFAYYLQVMKKRPTVTFDDLEECFALAGLSIPDVPKAVSNSERRFRLVKRESDNSVSVTRLGRNFIEDASMRDPVRIGKSNGTISAQNRGGSSPRTSALIPEVKGELDLFGQGGSPSFRSFAESKNPADNIGRIAVAAYFVTQLLGQPVFDEGDIYTCFEHMKWKSPAFLRNNIFNHRRSHGFYIVKEGKFGVTLKLKNFVEHELSTQDLPQE